MNLRERVDESFPNLTAGDLLSWKFTTDHSRRLERELYTLKWWDYRFMSPVEATMQFIDAFGVEAKKIYARDIDFEKAEYINFRTARSMYEDLENPSSRGRKSLDKIHTNAKKDFLSFWRARACADAMSIPYSDYCENILNFRMRAWRRVEMPLPSQLFGESDVLKTVARWEELQASRIYYASHYAYIPDNYRGAPAQIAYTRYLIEQARKRDFGASIRSMIENDKVSVPALREQLGDEEYLLVVESRSH